MKDKNKVVLITGASKGIGRATAIEFAKNGYDIVINYLNDDNGAEKTSESVLKYDVECMKIKCDVSSESQVKDMFLKIKEKYSTINCVINNAGIANDTLPFEKDIDDFKRVLDVNLIGPYLVSKYAKDYIEKGSIVNVSSTNALNTYYDYSLDYDASKAALVSLTHNLANILDPKIRVNAICPGWVNTEMNKELDKEYIEEECKNILLKRFAEPEEIAKVIVFLASDDASYINNSVIRIDGGMNGSY